MAKKRTKLAVQMSNNNETFDRRIDARVEQFRIAQQAIIDNMKKEQASMNIELENLMDFSPRSKDSLEPAHADKDPDKHMGQIQDLKVKMWQISIAIKEAEETYNTYFSEA